LENYFRVKGSEAIEEAVNLANNGQYEEGSKRIEVVMDQIAKSKKVNQQKM
jgi:transcription termination factor NusB